MKRSLLSLAALATLGFGLHALAADLPGQANARSGAVSPALQKAPGQTTTPQTPPPPPPPAVVPKIVSAKFLKNEIRIGEYAELKFDGINLAAGKTCHATVVWGDGTKFDNAVGDNSQWSTIKWGYNQPGNYQVVVTPKSYSGMPCVSDAPFVLSLKVNPPAPLPPSTITKLVVNPVFNNAKARMIDTVWVGSAPNAMCRYKIDFGDGTSHSSGAGAVQPGGTTQHVYASGTYTVKVTATVPTDSCSIGPDAGPKTFSVE